MPPAPKNRSFDRRIVDGPLPGAVWRLAWPTMLQNIIIPKLNTNMMRRYGSASA